ncbi:hypothetical protein GALL_544590 [mine drainage metagenome]|uniref:Uncharacterized protein n=1 Tax=mine drainage metagenome TaxID=410659 RepID=A0A1J5NYY8_9ZZZZ
MNNPTTTLAEHFHSIDQAAATALLAITGDAPAPAPAQSAFEELTRRNRHLLEGGAEAILETLARQATLLEAVVLALFTSAGNARNPNTARLALNGALSAQRSLVHTLGAIHQVRRG